jgi:hypothetical protein
MNAAGGRCWRAWRGAVTGAIGEWRWRHTALTGALIVLSHVWQSSVEAAIDAGAPSSTTLGLSQSALFVLPLVFSVRIADRAVEHGVAAPLAYATALLFAAIGGAVCAFQLRRWSLAPHGEAPLAGAVWSLLAWLIPAGLGVLAYGHWRDEQRALACLRASTLARGLQQRALRAARLLALQARVEPTLLYGTLQRVDAMIEIAPACADMLLADMIMMLRAMLPVMGSNASTIERELTLVQAYARVTGNVLLQPPQLSLKATAAARAAPFAPMIVMPILHTLTLHAPESWTLEAQRGAERLSLRITAGGPDGATARRALQALDCHLLRERLCCVHGNDAVLRVELGPSPALCIHVSCHENDRPDR